MGRKFAKSAKDFRIRQRLTTGEGVGTFAAFITAWKNTDS